MESQKCIFYIDFYFINMFFNYLALSNIPYFSCTQVLHKLPANDHIFCPRVIPATELQELGAGNENGEQNVVICELLESKGISQGAPTCHLMHSRADVMPLGRAVSLWQEQDNVCAECLYHLNFSSNATNVSGKSLMFVLEGITITLKTWSGFQNTAWVYCGDCLCLGASTEWLILRKNVIVHFIASVVLY